MTDIANRSREEIAPLTLRPKQDQLDEALAHFRDQVGQTRTEEG